jgi:hypothetical protein
MLKLDGIQEFGSMWLTSSWDSRSTDAAYLKCGLRIEISTGTLGSE